MAPVGTVLPGRRSTAPMVPRVGGTGIAVPADRSSSLLQRFHGGAIAAYWARHAPLGWQNRVFIGLGCELT